MITCSNSNIKLILQDFVSCIPRISFCTLSTHFHVLEAQISEIKQPIQCLLLNMLHNPRPMNWGLVFLKDWEKNMDQNRWKQNNQTSQIWTILIVSVNGWMWLTVYDRIHKPNLEKELMDRQCSSSRPKCLWQQRVSIDFSTWSTVSVEEDYYST